MFYPFLAQLEIIVKIIARIKKIAKCFNTQKKVTNDLITHLRFIDPYGTKTENKFFILLKNLKMFCALENLEVEIKIMICQLHK